MITIHLDEDSVYFAEMTEAQADKMEDVLSKSKYPWDIEKIKESPGFHSFKDLMKDFKELRD